MAKSDTRHRKLEDRVRAGVGDADLRSEITDLIYRDDLTGLFNRRHLRELLTNEVNWSLENPVPFSILMIDVDYFKQVNDTYGHLCGDHVLVYVSQLLLASFRRTDIVTRYAGDEFIVVLPATDKDTAFMLADRTRQRVSGFKYLHEDGKTEIAVGMSIGVASFPTDASGPGELIEQADRALYASKRAGRGIVSRAMEGPVDSMRGDDVLRLFPCSELVGREEIMSRIAQYLPEPVPKAPTLVILEGGPGVGKTRLLTEIVKATHLEGITCLLERCSEENAVVPYQALIELMSQFASRHIEDVVRILKGGAVEEMVCLSGVMPEVAAHLPPDTPALAMKDKQRRQVLFNALANLFAAVSRSRPIAILLDDFHNVDQGSLAVLTSLQKKRDVHIGMFGAMPFGSFKEEGVKEKPLGKFFEAEGGGNPLVEIKVEPLKKQDVTRMVSALFPGRKPDDSFDAALFRASGGNPLHIEELLKCMASRELIAMEGGRWHIAPLEQAELPASLDAAIRKHLQKLDSETADVLASAAVIGSNFRLDLLQHVTGRNEGYTLHILDKARRAAVVAPFSDDQDEEISFASSSIRDVSYDDTPEGKRKSLHAQVAESEERRHKDDIDSAAPRIAYHYQHADMQDKAEEYEARVRARAESLFELSEAISFAQKKLATKLREGAQPLSPPAMKRIGKLFADLCNAIEARRSQPPGSANAVNATRTVLQTLKPILDEADAITIAEKSSGLTVNNVPLDPKEYRGATMEFWDTLLRHNGEGLTVTRGADEREIDVFLVALAEDSEVFIGLLWAAWLGENDVTHLYVDQRVRSLRIIKEPDLRASHEEKKPSHAPEREKKPEPPKAIRTRDEIRTAGPEAITEAPAQDRELDAVKEIFYGSEEDLLTREQMGLFSRTLKTALLKNNTRALEAFTNKLTARIASPSVNLQLQATELVGNAMKQATTLGNQFFIIQLENLIFDALNVVKDLRIFGMFVELGCEGVITAIKRGDYESAKKLVWAFQRLRRPGLSGSPGSRHAELALERLAKSDAFNLLLADIASGDPARQSSAASLLIGFGTTAVPSLVAIIRDSADYRVRKTAADILKESGAEACRQLMAQLTPLSPPEHYVRILSVLDAVSSNIRSDLDLMLRHPDEQIRRDAVKVFTRLPRHEGRDSLVELAYSADPATAAGAISALGDLAWPPVAPELAHLFPSLKSEALQQECCIALGKTQNPGAVPLLARILGSKGFLGRFGAKSPAVRSAAAWALGQLGGAEAIELLQESASDRDPMVRAAVQQALQRLR